MVSILDSSNNVIDTFSAGSSMATVAINSLVTLGASPNFIGLTTTIIGSSPSVQVFGQFYPTAQSIASGGLGPVLLDNFGRIQTVIVGNLTIDSGNISLKGNVTIQDGGNSITVDATDFDIRDLSSATDSVSIKSGNVTVQAIDLDIRDLTSVSDSVAIKSGNVTIQAVDLDIRDLSSSQDNVAIRGNLTLADSKGYIGLVTLGGGTAWTDPKTFIGLATVTIGAGGAGDGAILDGVDSSIKASVTSIADGRYLHVGIKSNSTVLIGNTPDVSIKGNITLSDSKGYIGLVTIAQPISTTFSGNVTLDAGSKTAIVGNLTLSDSKGFIGLVTIVPTYLSTYTSFSTVISALATIIVPPAGQRIIVKDIFISSLGRTEMSIWAARGTTTINMTPPTALATTGGYVLNLGDSGQRWPAVDDALTVRSGSTIGMMINLRFES